MLPLTGVYLTLWHFLVCVVVVVLASSIFPCYFLYSPAHIHAENCKCAVKIKHYHEEII